MRAGTFAIAGILALVAVARAQQAVPDAASLDDYQAARRAADNALRDRAASARTPIAQSGAVDPDQYIVGPGDQFSLRMRGRVMRDLTLTVTPDGLLVLPESAPLQVAGLSLSEVRRRVIARLAPSFRGVEADLRLTDLRSFKVFLTGAVEHPGAVEVNATMRASEVLGPAMLQVNASRRNVSVRRRDGSTVRADLELLLSAGDPVGDPDLRDGDVLHVPVATEFVQASGAVRRPARYELAPGDSLATLLRLAGGVAPAAGASQALFVRFTGPTQQETLRVDARALAPEQAALPLRDGDGLFVFFTPDYHQLRAIEIVGEVGHPGSYPIREGRDRLSDAIRWAGGFGARANSSGIQLLRATPGSDPDPEIDRLARLPREQMTESEYARLQARLAENKNSFRLDWARVTAPNRSADLDPLLVGGDVVRIEPLVSTVRVEGQVRNPGLIEYRRGRSADEYVRLAGGFTDRAAPGGVRVTRAVNGQVAPARSVRELSPGDLLWVPERREHDPWAVFRDVLGVAGQIAVVVVALRK